MDEDTKKCAALKFCRSLFATSNLIGTDFDDVRMMEIVKRDFPQQPGGDGVHVTFSVSWHAIGKAGEDAGTERPLPDCHRRRHVSRDSGLKGVDEPLRMLAEPPVFVHQSGTLTAPARRATRYASVRPGPPRALRWLKCKQASRWLSPTMPARYAAGELAGRGAVAQLRDGAVGK